MFASGVREARMDDVQVRESRLCGGVCGPPPTVADPPDRSDRLQKPPLSFCLQPPSSPARWLTSFDIQGSQPLNYSRLLQLYCRPLVSTSVRRHLYLDLSPLVTSTGSAVPLPVSFLLLQFQNCHSQRFRGWSPEDLCLRAQVLQHVLASHSKRGVSLRKPLAIPTTFAI